MSISYILSVSVLLFLIALVIFAGVLDERKQDDSN